MYAIGYLVLAFVAAVLKQDMWAIGFLIIANIHLALGRISIEIFNLEEEEM